MSLIFELKASSSQEEGFSLKVKADNQIELNTAKELSELLISKIEKIRINISTEDE